MGAPARDIRLVHEDPRFVIADKPSGLLVHRGWANDDDTALFRVRDKLGHHVYPVHRLDRGTSGALLLARDPDSQRTLSALFEAGQVVKSYLALVRGTPPAEGTIDHPIPRTEGGPRVAAVTTFRLLSTSPRERCSLVEARPQTGRLHQVRRHLAHLSHPLIGDVNYGRGDVNRHYRASYDLHRLALHAWKLAFDHPWSNTRFAIQVDVATELATAFATLGLVLS